MNQSYPCIIPKAIKNSINFTSPTCGLVNLDLSNININENQDKYEQNNLDLKDSTTFKGSKNTYKFIKNRIKQKGSLLDIGCRNGALLYFARNDGWHVKGIEISNALAKQVKKDLDIDVLAMNFVDTKIFDSQFDLITMRHVLEHIPESNLVMTRIHNILKPNGFAVRFNFRTLKR